MQHFDEYHNSMLFRNELHEKACFRLSFYFSALKRQGPESATNVEIYDYASADNGQMSGMNCKLITD